MSDYVNWGLTEEPAPKTMATREADYVSVCDGCDEEILPGDTITLEDDAWLHESCADR
jgi:hypothetical protein